MEVTMEVFTETTLEVGRFILNAFARSWWLLLLTIPVAVFVNVSGAARYVRSAVMKRPAISILLAALLGSVSPLCSCSVIPMILSLLTGGVPLAPVMTFWIASPSMDVEVFFLSVSTLGWDLAIWRLASTFCLSIAAGIITHVLVRRGWIGDQVLRTHPLNTRIGIAQMVRAGWQAVGRMLTVVLNAGARSLAAAVPPVAAEAVYAGPAGLSDTGVTTSADDSVCGDSACGDSAGAPSCGTACAVAPRQQLVTRIARESMKSILFVGKFMLLAYAMEALIVMFVPQTWITSLLGPGNPLAIPAAALIGVPAYVTNLSSLGLLGGLLQNGMVPGAALAFLIAGPTTTLPALSAVFGITTRRVFMLYLAFAFCGALLFGGLHMLVSLLA
jgi:uncharacterized membrane protein YraQ (UPF0718 family)